MTELENTPRPHRLHALCPYFAMFPASFADENLRRHTKPGAVVLDPFSGRGTTLLEALLGGRQALASDINPVAYCVSAAKASRPQLELIQFELDELEDAYYRADVGRLESERSALPPFFDKAFTGETLRQLLFLRRRLEWRTIPEHRFIAALALGHLHGESDRSPSYCSNQMPHSISTKPEYSLKYWQEHKLSAPERDVFDLLRDRADYRLEDGVPDRRGRVSLVDVRQAAGRFRSFAGKVMSVITSPPYLDTTRFEEDQWLRLWFLGGAPRPTYHQVSKDDRHEFAASYWTFLQESWRGIAPLLHKAATLVCRFGIGRLSVDGAIAGLSATVLAVWPRAELILQPAVTTLHRRQTSILHPDSVGSRYEVDLSFAVRAAT
jgi:DNA methylase